MSPVSRYLVTAFDYDRYEIVVEARNEPDAINKALAIYGFHGSYEEFEITGSDVRWSAVPLVQEIQR